MVRKLANLLLLLAGLLCLAFGGPEEGISNPGASYFVLEASPTPTSSVFIPYVYTSVSKDPLPRDIEGFVLDKNGAPLAGIRAKVSSPGWEAYDATRGNGLFKFTLTEGEFSITLPDVVSQPAFIKVDNKTSFRIEFREIVGTTTTPTPISTPITKTTPTVTTTPTITTTPTVTTTPTETPTPSLTSPTVIRISATPSVTPTPERGSSSSTRKLSLLPQLSFGSWVKTLFVGAGLGAIVFVFSIILARLRH